MALTTGIIFGLLAMIGWGVADFFAKIAVEKIGIYKTYLYPALFGAIPLIVYFIFFPQFTKLSMIIILLFVFGTLIDFLGYMFYYRGMEKEKVSVLSPIVACNPIVVIFLSILILKEFLSLNQGLGIIAAVIGLVMVSIENKKFMITSKAIVYGIPTMLFWGVSIFILGYLVRESNWLIAALMFRFFGGFYGFIYPKLKNINLRITKINFIYLLILIGIVETSATVFYNLGVSSEFISIIGPIAALYPAVTLILARMFMKEKLFSIQKFGIAAIFLGLVLVSV